LYETGDVSVQNVPSYRLSTGVRVEVEGHGPVTGDVAWGGNWFFLVADHGQELSLRNIEKLTDFSWRLRQALVRQGVTGANGAEIDHIELFADSSTPGVDSRNFVLCPGKAYDRSPCGTGTSAKLACLFADGKLKEGEVWRQESIVGSVFRGSIRRQGDALVPTIRGSAYITAETTLILDPSDPFRTGIGT
jgi:4-hydroxyproline epimerase